MHPPTLREIINEDVEIPLSDDDIKTICNGKVLVISYAHLESAAADSKSATADSKSAVANNGLMQLFKPELNNCICLLYQFPGQRIGHWVSIIYYEDTDEINFQNSFGYAPDKETGRSLLTELLKATGKKINISRIRYQNLEGNTSTCGLHSAIRCVFNEYTNEEYYKMLNSISINITGDSKNSRFDKLVSLMSVLPLKFNIPQDGQ